MRDEKPSDTRCGGLHQYGSHVQRGHALMSPSLFPSSTDGFLLNIRHSAEGGNENETKHTNHRCTGNVGNNGC